MALPICRVLLDRDAVPLGPFGTEPIRSLRATFDQGCDAMLPVNGMKRGIYRAVTAEVAPAGHYNLNALGTVRHAP